MAVVQSRALRVVLLILGFASLGLGVIGIFLPLLPTTPFILLTAWCFLKSSEKAHRWIYQQPILGNILRDWETNRSIKRSTKIVAATMIFTSLVFLWIRVETVWVKIFVSILLIVVSTFIITRKE